MNGFLSPLSRRVRSRRRPPSRRVAASRRAMLLAAIVLLAAIAGLARAQGGEEAAEAAVTLEPRNGPIVHLRIDSAIHPVAGEFLAESLAEADAADAAVVIVELDTPGGLLTTTRDMVSALLSAESPVVVYVAPGGAQAASAGFFLLLAADVAAMAPGTNTGASSPIAGNGEDIDDTLRDKAFEDTSAMIRSIAQQRGRNVELAETAVTEARSFTAQEALEANLIDLIAPDFEALLEQLDGREVLRPERSERLVLATAGKQVEEVEMDLFQKILSVVADPSIALWLLSLGGLGLILEFYNPGAILPGVVGAICIVLAFFGMSVLPVNYAGVALIALAMVFFIAEIKVTSYGLLTVGGVICLVFGGLMLIKTPDPALRVSVEAIASLAAFFILAVLSLMFLVLRAHRHQVTTGTEGMIHEVGRARTELAPRGKVFVHGELWDAVAESPVAAGEEVEVVAVQRMTLRVRRHGAGQSEHEGPPGGGLGRTA